VSDADWEEKVVGLEAEVAALRKLISVLLYLMVGNGLVGPSGLRQVSGILGEDLHEQARGLDEDSPRRRALEEASEVVKNAVEAGLAPLPEVEEEAHAPWATRTQLAAVESLVAALVVSSLQGREDVEALFSAIRQGTLQTAQQREWRGESATVAQRLKVDSQAETDRLLLGIAKALGVELRPGGVADASRRAKRRQGGG